MTEEAKALELFDQATKAVRASDLSNREVIEGYGHAAMRAIDVALKRNDFRNAIDTLEKTRAIEDYVKFQIRNKRATVVDANRMVVVVFKIIRELGWWLDENLVVPGSTKKYSSNIWPEIAAVLKPKFYLEDLGISAVSSHRWQKIASLPEEEFEAYIKPFLEVEMDEKDRDALLSVNKLLIYISAMEKTVEVIKAGDVDLEIDLELTKNGRAVYDNGKALQTAVLDWLMTISEKEKMPGRELLFLEQIMYAHYHYMGGVMKTITKEVEARGLKKKAA
jgi:hypothetical protein